MGRVIKNICIAAQLIYFHVGQVPDYKSGTAGVPESWGV